MAEETPPNTRPIPFQGNGFSFTETVREMSVLAIAFAEDFERLLELYKIKEYSLYVRSDMFTLNHSEKLDESTESADEEQEKIQVETKETTKSFPYKLPEDFSDLKIG